MVSRAGPARRRPLVRVPRPTVTLPRVRRRASVGPLWALVLCVALLMGVLVGRLGQVLPARASELHHRDERVGHTHWLNPEAKREWGTGDSAARLYAQYVPMHECRNVEQLTAVVAGLLPV